MNLTGAAAHLLAELEGREWSDALRRGFQHECSETHAHITLIVVAALCGLLLVLWLTRRVGDLRHAGADYLVAGARVLRLARSELHDLRTVARRAHLAYPAAMLLSPANLAQALRSSQAETHDAALGRRLDRLARTVFGVPLPDESITRQPSPPDVV